MKKSFLLVCLSSNIFCVSNAFSEQSKKHFLTEEKLDIVQPNYDFFLGAGLFFPTIDSTYFSNFYSSQPTYHFDGQLSRIYWLGNFGISVGLLGRYTANTGSSVNTSATDPTQQTKHEFYAITGEGIAGIRYRNPNWAYLQPGIYGGVGANYFNENILNSSNTLPQQTQTTSQLSPVYEVGANLDVSFTSLTTTPNEIQGDIPPTVQDVLFRAECSYAFNSVRTAPSLGGLFATVGIGFLLQ